MREKFGDNNLFTGPTPKSHLHFVRVLSALSRGESIGQATEPVTYKQSLAAPDSKDWLLSKEDKVEALERNNTWILVHPEKEGIP